MRAVCNICGYITLWSWGDFILILDEEEGEGFLVWIEMKKFKVQKQKEL